jgi:hypothetical protein
MVHGFKHPGCSGNISIGIISIIFRVDLLHEQKEKEEVNGKISTTTDTYVIFDIPCVLERVLVGFSFCYLPTYDEWIRCSF